MTSRSRSSSSGLACRRSPPKEHGKSTLEEIDNGARKDQLEEKGIEDGPGKRGDRWEMDWEDILQEEEKRRARENEEGEEEDEYMVFGGLDDEEAEVVRHPSRTESALDGKDEDEVSVTQEEEIG